MLKKKIEIINLQPLTNLYLIKEFMRKQKITTITYKDNWINKKQEYLSIVIQKD